MIHDAAKELKHAWRKARESWQDDNAQRFAREVLEPLAPKIRSAVSGIDALGAAEQRARAECG